MENYILISGIVIVVLILCYSIYFSLKILYGYGNVVKDFISEGNKSRNDILGIINSLVDLNKSKDETFVDTIDGMSDRLISRNLHEYKSLGIPPPVFEEKAEDAVKESGEDMKDYDVNQYISEMVAVHGDIILSEPEFKAECERLSGNNVKEES